ncbi:glycosyltransferase [Aeromonas caviae]|uniref:glycosyltransferase family 2 protein n=1 Tax=Aeromonas caviae TaxID=648 RepID=UPI00244CBFBC|nr:glycosyltransferase family 2 protein [Aeromonas caviae]MDH0474536.1 glycosyltransferase [Aeromonas caviae]
MNIKFKKPAVSIIMPAYNSAGTISDSIRSVIGQDFEEWELIICDDKSVDDTIKQVKMFDDPRITLVHNNYGKGAALARNYAISFSKGRYIAFLDSDDLWHPRKLSTQYEYMMENDLAFSYGDYHVFHEKSNLTHGLFRTPATINYEMLKKTCPIGCLTVMLDKEKINDISMMAIPKEDYATWLRLFKEYNPCNSRYPGVLAYYRVGQSSLSSNKLKEIFKQFRVLRVVTKENVFSCWLYVFYYILHGFLKHFFSYRKKMSV